MNHVFNTVWSHTLNAWIVASEHTSRCGKRAGSARRMINGVGILGLTFIGTNSALAVDLPVGGQIVHGNGQISTPNSNQMVIDQASQKLAIDWQKFDIGSGNTVTFKQPDSQSIALNRVLGSDGSKIMGTLEANGRVFLVNPNGVLFGTGASVDVGGLVASTLDISVDDFAAGNYSFKGDGSNASVINNGTIVAADGGAIALLGGTVSNNGVIVANQGSVALTAGNTVTLDFAGDGLLNVQVDEAVINALVENNQLIKADGGQVLLTANAGEALLKTVVNNTGVIEAQTLGEKNGKIVLLGGFDGGTTLVSGTLDASAPDGGNGGFIETSGAHVKITDSAKVTTLANTGNSGTWLIDPNDFTVAASDGDMTGAAVSNALSNNGNFIIETTASGTTGGNGDIHINDAIEWRNSSALTLSAERDINIRADISSTHSGKLVLEYGQGSVAADNSADYHLKNDAKVNLTAGDNFSTKLGSDGSIREYKVITQLGSQGSTTGEDLQGINGDLYGSYALGSNINASDTFNWNEGLGFAPIGTLDRKFNGVLHGLGHQISGLTINRPDQDQVGLFGDTHFDSTLRNLGLVGGSVIGRDFVGSLVGSSWSTINNSYATGAVAGQNSVGGLAGVAGWNTISNVYATGTVTGVYYVGGLLGGSSSNIVNAYATGAVTGNGNFVGGLIGNHGESIISNAYATGAVTGYASNVGGLAGYSLGEISNAYATGAVIGEYLVGGLVGHTYGDISNAYATGTVVGGDDVGGLVGRKGWGIVRDTYATGSVSGQNVVGGLIGRNNYSETSNSYASGMVTGISYVGGLVGNNYDSTINSSYAEGVVQGQNDVGGLVGLNWGDISNSYASGMVTGVSYVGGLVGENSGSTIDSSYAVGAVQGQNDVGGLVGLNWGDISNSYATGAINGDWNIGGLVGYSTNTIINAYAAGGVVGNNFVGGLVGNSGSEISNSYAIGAVSGLDDVGGLVGYNYNGSISNAYAVGRVKGQNRVGGLVGDNSFGTISSTYALGMAEGQDSVGGLVGSNSGTVNNSFYATTNIDGAIINSGGDSNGSYTGNSLGYSKSFLDLTLLKTFVDASWGIDGVGATNNVWRIYDGNSTPLLRSFLKPATVAVGSSTDSTNKAYDGSIINTNFTYTTEQPNLILDGAATYSSASSNVGTYSSANGNLRYGLFSDQQGYDITIVGDPVLTITPKALAIKGLQANDKVYDGSTNATLIGAYLDGLIGDETLTLSGFFGDFSDPNVGSNKTVYIAGGSLGDGSGLASNYSVINPTELTADISRANLTVTANDANKTYDGKTWSGGNGLKYDGFVNNEDASILDGEVLYGGSAQGARDFGSYIINVNGLRAHNYAISYQSGTLEIGRPLISETTTYGAILASLPVEAVLKQNSGLSLAESDESYSFVNNATIIESGIRLPEGL